MNKPDKATFRRVVRAARKAAESLGHLGAAAQGLAGSLGHLADAEKERILKEYAERVRLSMISAAAPREMKMAREQPEEFEANVRESTREALAQGQESWSRLQAVVVKYRRDRERNFPSYL